MDVIPYRLFFKAISNTTRIRIIELLKEKPRNVTEICQGLGFEQSRVSHALKCLANCGFVSAKWNNGNRIYSLNGELSPILSSIDKHIKNYRKQLIECGVLKERKT